MRKRSKPFVPVVVLIALSSVFYLGCASKDTRPDPNLQQDKDIIPKGKLPRTAIPKHYRIELDINPDLEQFEGAVEIDIELKEATQRIFLHGADLNVTGANLLQGQTAIPLTFKQLNEHGLAEVTSERLMDKGPGTLRFHYTAPFTKGLRGLYKVKSNKLSYAFTQFEATSARYAFPSFDEPGFKTPFDITVITAFNHKAISTTPELKTLEREDGKIGRVFKTTAPLPTYLLSFTVGDLEIVDAPAIPANDFRKAPLPFRAITVAGQSEKVAYALKETPKLLQQLEKYFSIGYPFQKLDIIAVPDFRAGAMENVGAVTFREIYLLIDEQAASSNQKRRFANIMAHELAHMWFGNLVTTAWWDDIWLNEAFATWMAAKIVHQVYPEYDYPVVQWSNTRWAMGEDALASARQIREDINSEHDIANAFDGITYVKGAQFLSMLETLMGPEKFRDGMNHYMTAHRFQNATYQDLIKALETKTESNLIDVAKSFLFQPGTPYVERINGELVQSRYRPLGATYESAKTWNVPVCGAQTKACTILTQTNTKLDDTVLKPIRGKTSDLSRDAHLNQDSAGYYRFWPGDAAVAALFEGQKAAYLPGQSGQHTFSDIERMSLVDAIIARFEMGRLSLEKFLSWTPVIFQDPNVRISSQLLDPLTFILRHAPEKDRPTLSERLKTAIQPLTERIGIWPVEDETPTLSMIRPMLINFLAFELGDKAIQEQLSEKAWDYLGFSLNGKVVVDAVPSDLVPQIIRAGFIQHGSQFTDIAINRLKSTRDPLTRQNLLSALASHHDLTQRLKIIELALTEEIRENEVMTILYLSAEHDPIWTWKMTTRNYEALSKRIPVRHQARLTQILSYAADKSAIDTLETFFSKRIEDMNGGPRQLELSKERITIHSALKNYLLEQLASS